MMDSHVLATLSSSSFFLGVGCLVSVCWRIFDKYESQATPKKREKRKCKRERKKERKSKEKEFIENMDGLLLSLTSSDVGRAGITGPMRRFRREFGDLPSLLN